MEKYIEVGGFHFGFKVLTTEYVYELKSPSCSRMLEETNVSADRLYGDSLGWADASLEVAFKEEPLGVSWQAKVKHSEPIKGIKVSLPNLPLGKVILSSGFEFEPRIGEVRIFNFWQWMYTGYVQKSLWPAAFLLIETSGETLLIYANEYPPRSKRCWITRIGDHLQVDLYSEENAWERSATYTAPRWTIERVKDWREAVDKYASWMEKAYGLIPFEERKDMPDWAKKIALVVNLHGRNTDGKICHTFAEMEERLREIARLFPPEHTLVYIPGWDRYDYNPPDYVPDSVLGGDEGFKRFMKSAHQMGLKIELHMDPQMLSYKSGLYPKFKQFHYYDAEGREQGDIQGIGFDIDYDGICNKMHAFISYACEE